MRLADYEFSRQTRKDINLVDFINDIRQILNLGRYQLRVVTSVPTWTGDEGELLLFVSGSVRRLYFYDITNSTWHYTEWNNAGLGQATIVGTVSLTGQTGDIGATTIYTPAVAGQFRVSVYALCTTAGGGTIDVNINWTDDSQAQTTVAINDLNLAGAGNAQSNVIFIRSTATVITYSTTITGKTGSPQYSLWIVLEEVV